MMSFTEWRLWYKSQHITAKWFILLLVFRPLLDNFYFLKEISPLLSPLYWIGVLTPVFIIWSFLSRSFKPKYKAPIGDLLFGTFGLVIIVNSLLLLFNNYSMKILGDIIKYITPVFLFFYVRHIITTKKDFEGLL